MEKKLFTSESVSEGHPDKVCDQISDAVLDACLSIDPDSHVACECFATKNYILVGGEITCNGEIDVEGIVRDVLKKIGYDRPELECDYHTVIVDNKIHQQSPDINMGVSRGTPETQGAGDQGLMFGYATNETEGYMPLPISIAHKLVREASELRHKGLFKGSRPDMKSQVTIDYTGPDHIRIDTILMSVQHDPDVNIEEFKTFISKGNVLGLAIGIIIGGISGYFGGKVDLIMMRVVDIIYSLPDMLIIILLMMNVITGKKINFLKRINLFQKILI